MLQFTSSLRLYGPNHKSDHDYLEIAIAPGQLPDAQYAEVFSEFTAFLKEECGAETAPATPQHGFVLLLEYIQKRTPPSYILNLHTTGFSEDSGILTVQLESRYLDLPAALLNRLGSLFRPHFNRKALTTFFHTAFETIRTKSALSESNDLLLAAAERLHIPAMLMQPFNPIIMLGYGNRRLITGATMTNRLGVLSDKMSHDKFQTQQILRRFGLPTSNSVRIRSEQDLEAAAINPGFPMVIKPLDGLQGRGITLNIRNLSEAKAAYHFARSVSPVVLAEKYIPGYDNRIMIMKGKATHAVSRRIPTVIGDGEHTVQELMDIENRTNPLRLGKSYTHKLMERSEKKDVHLEKLGLDYSYVPQKREVVELLNAPNVGQGGFCLNLMDHIHPANLRLAEEAARALDMDFAGVDLVSPDCSRPFWETGTIIVEVNSMPHLRPICAADQDNALDTIDAFLRAILPTPAKAITELSVVIGPTSSEKAFSLSQSLTQQGAAVGIYTPTRTLCDGFPLTKNISQRDQINALLFNPSLDHILIAENLDLIDRNGLGYRYINTLYLQDLPVTVAGNRSVDLLIRHTVDQVVIPVNRPDISERIRSISPDLKIHEKSSE